MDIFMNINLSRLLIIITLLCSATFSQAEEGRHNMTFMTGVVQMSNTSQTINNENYKFIDKTYQVFAFDYERLQANGYSFGVGGLAHSNDIIYDSSTDPENRVDILHVAGMARKYFKVTEYIQPYLGLGYGFALTSGVGRSSLSFQSNIHAVAGLKMKFDKTTLKIEYRNINTDKRGGNTFYLTSQSLLIGFTIKIK